MEVADAAGGIAIRKHWRWLHLLGCGSGRLGLVGHGGWVRALTGGRVSKGMQTRFFARLVAGRAGVIKHAVSGRCWVSQLRAAATVNWGIELPAAPGAFWARSPSGFLACLGTCQSRSGSGSGPLCIEPPIGVWMLHLEIATSYCTYTKHTRRRGRNTQWRRARTRSRRLPRSPWCTCRTAS